MIGTVLGNRYEIIEKIGEGGMSEVYKAKDRLLSRFVAVKILKKEYLKDIEFVDKFKAEATAAGSISHNNIVNIYDVGAEDDINYIVMEYVHGRTLKEVIIQNGRLDYNRAIDIAIQIAKAIECAHKNNIIHRDIKPQNILVTDEGNVKVTDFGIAKAANSVTITNTNKVMGSAHYFSPEQAKGAFVDGRTDIYSLGVVIYEMVTGRVPYDAESPVSIALKHLQEPVFPPKQINNNIPEGLNNLILKAMEKEPIARYQNIKDMLLDLQRIKNNSDYKVELDNPFNDHTRIMQPVTSYEDNENNEEVEEASPKKNNKKLALILVPLGILVIAIFFFSGWYIMSKNQGGHKTNVTIAETSIPNVVGLSEEEAQKSIKYKGLKFVVASREKSNQPEGTVISTLPAEGTTVKVGSEVYAYISSGVFTEPVPNVKDLDYETAVNTIKNNGFAVGNVDYEHNDTTTKGTVVRQSPDYNTKLEKGSKIDLVISKGPEKKYATVPNLINKSLKEAENLIKGVNLKVGTITSINTEDKSLDGKVANQSPAANTENIEEGTSVDISYYKYKEVMVNLPDFDAEKWVLKDAINYLRDNGLIANPQGDINDPVIQQDKRGPVSKGTTVTLISAPEDDQDDDDGTNNEGNGDKGKDPGKGNK